MNVHSSTLTTHTPCNYIHNANTLQKTHAHTNMHPCTPTNTCKVHTHNLSLPSLCLSPPSVSHPCTHHTQHASTVTPMFDLLLKLHQLHSTSPSEVWSAIAARALAEAHWGGRPLKSSFVCVEQPLIPFSISRHSAAGGSS